MVAGYDAQHSTELPVNGDHQQPAPFQAEAWQMPEAKQGTADSQTGSATGDTVNVYVPSQESGGWVAPFAGGVVAGALGYHGITHRDQLLNGLTKAHERLGGMLASARAYAGGLTDAVDKPREFAHPESVTTQQESSIGEDVQSLYERSFPAEERQPVSDIQELMNSGQIRLDTTRDAEGNLDAISFTSIHDADSTHPFAHLDYIATDPELRSTGIGSLHLQRLNDSLRQDPRGFVATTLEMEDPKAPGLTNEDRAVRERRALFYDRLGARNVLPGGVNEAGEYVPGYKILDFDKTQDSETWTPVADNQPAEFRAFVHDPARFDPRAAASLFYQSESGYDLSSDHPAVAELNRLFAESPGNTVATAGEAVGKTSVVSRVPGAFKAAWEELRG